MLRYISAALVVMALTAGLTACDNKISDIIGVWETTNLPDDQYLTFEFSKDGTLTITKPGNGGYGYDYYEAKGTWSRNDDHLYLSYQGQDDVIDARILSVDKNSLVLQQGDDNDGILYLKRIKKSSAKKSIADRMPDTNNTEEDVNAAQEDDEDEYAEEEESAMNLPTSGYINGHGYVDLGLSVKWATCNVGASSPSDYGNYYAWGEIRTKSEYTTDNSLAYRDSLGSIAGSSQYDAARANWGGTWRMPTKDELYELKNCEHDWVTVDGHSGYRITGPNGNSIFLPAAGERSTTSLNNAGAVGSYWSATPDDEDWDDYCGAYELGFGSGGFFTFDHGYYGAANCYSGQSVRPVSK